jgi:DNA-binding GntR family transcriptional regulator
LAVNPIAKLSPVQHQPAPLRTKIIAALRSAIETGLLQPGARLVERDLCAQLNVSRTSLREALRELEADGILLQAGARGLSVGIVSREEARNAFRIRAVLEALVVEQFIERAAERDLRGLAKDAEALKAAYRSGEVAKILVGKRQFWERLCGGAQNAMAFDIINRLALRTSSLHSRSLARKPRQTQSVAEIDAVVAAIRARDVDAARRAAAEHVTNAMNSVLSVLAEAEHGAGPAPPAGGSRRRAKALTTS